MNLILERKSETDDKPLRISGKVVMITPPISDSYWTYRVQVGGGQSIVGFPKFSTIGCGFAVEDDWNTNLPVFNCTADEIWNHIKHNKGSATATDVECLAAIQMIREAASKDNGQPLTGGTHTAMLRELPE